MSNPEHPKFWYSLNEYQADCLPTASYPKEQGLLYTALALGGEAGELQNLLKKTIRGDYSLDLIREAVIDELGDVLWYCAMLAHELGVPLAEVADRNIEKLKERYAKKAASDQPA